MNWQNWKSHEWFIVISHFITETYPTKWLRQHLLLQVWYKAAWLGHKLVMACKSEEENVKENSIYMWNEVGSSCLYVFRF